MRERFSMLKVISWTSHGLLSFLICLLLMIVAVAGVYYLRQGEWVWMLLAAGVFVFGVVVFINAWRLRLTEL